jgi:hypothetical protein
MLRPKMKAKDFAMTHWMLLPFRAETADSRDEPTPNAWPATMTAWLLKGGEVMRERKDGWVCSRQWAPNSASVMQVPSVGPGERASVSIRLPRGMMRVWIGG